MRPQERRARLEQLFAMVGLEARRLEEAQNALLSSRLSSLREVSAVEQAAVHKAQRDLEEARDKQRRLLRWSRELGPRTQVLVKQLGTLDSFLTQDMGRAVVWLTEALRALTKYSELRVAAAPPSTEASDEVGDGAVDETGGTTESAATSPQTRPSSVTTWTPTLSLNGATRLIQRSTCPNP